MSYNVYTAETAGSPLNHIAIFVETSPGTGAGIRFHVDGSVLVGQGMQYNEESTVVAIEYMAEYVPDSKVQVGTVRETDMEQLRAICQDI